MESIWRHDANSESTLMSVSICTRLAPNDHLQYVRQVLMPVRQTLSLTGVALQTKRMRCGTVHHEFGARNGRQGVSCEGLRTRTAKKRTVLRVRVHVCCASVSHDAKRTHNNSPHMRTCIQRSYCQSLQQEHDTSLAVSCGLQSANEKLED